MLATATLLPGGRRAFYYLVSSCHRCTGKLRDPNGPPGAGIPTNRSPLHRRASALREFGRGVCIVNVAVPGQPFYVPLYGQLGASKAGTRHFVFTHGDMGTVLWLVTCGNYRLPTRANLLAHMTVTTGLLWRATRTPLPAPPHAYPTGRGESPPQTRPTCQNYTP